MSSISSEDVARVKAGVDCREIFERFWPQRIKKRSGSTWMALCPFHDDRNPSFAIKRSHAKCFAGCRPPSGKAVFDCFDLVAAATGKSFVESVRSLAEGASILLEKSIPGSPVPQGSRRGKAKGKVELHRSPAQIVATYDYVDKAGNLIFQVVRLDPKGFLQRRRSETGEWSWNLDGAQRVLYRLPEVIAAQSVVICEGEKDVDNVRQYLPADWAATIAPGGAGKWHSDYTKVLSGKDVVSSPTPTIQVSHISIY